MNYNAFNSIESLDMPNIVKKPWSSFIIDGSDAYNNDKMDFPSFKSSNLFRRGKRSMPLSIPSKITLSSSTTTMEIKLPTAQELNNGEPISESNSKSGLWLSHFGNFNEGKVTEKSVHEALDFASKNDENVFLTKYAKPRNKILARSLEHAAMERMSAGCTDCKDLINDEALLRVLLAPLLLGSLSTKQLYHYGAANNNQNLRNSAISKDFHRILAGMPQNRGDENYEYVMFNGQLTRFSKRRTDNHNKESAIFIHGFGASGYQFQPLIKALTRAAGADSKSKFPSKLFALDLLGFGQSEKPALTYTQYLWEAQVAHFCDFAAEGEKFIVGGNSIGGYSAMAAAADYNAISSDAATCSGTYYGGGERCKGLVLFNTAGRCLSKDEVRAEVVRNGSSKTIAERTISNQLNEFSAPGKLQSICISAFLLSTLRLFIKPICRKLYPFAPENVTDELCENIKRDSEDPGAICVMVSGAKLPPPRLANELLGADFGAAAAGSGGKEGVFIGKVVVIQGLDDPLNDARDRANKFEALRDGVEVRGIEAGHCVHDEKPDDCSRELMSCFG